MQTTITSSRDTYYANLGDTITPSIKQDSVKNRLLNVLPAELLAELLPDLVRVRMELRQTMYEPEQPIQHVFFPETTVASLTSPLGEGRVVEVGTVGCEGMIGLPLFLTGDRPSIEAFSQVPGDALRMDAEPFMRFASPPGPLHTLLLRYTQAFLTQVSQSAVCNGSHLLERRCARWLLMTHDRVHGDSFALTHEFMAYMLGVRRAGVTVAMGALQDAGLIGYSRGQVSITDRTGLEGASCECYALVRAHYERLLPVTM